MRPIEFRAWSKEHSCMLYEDDVATLSDVINIGRDNKALMQFTGLLDLNGVKIWEGDIVTIYNGTKEAVRWDDGGFKLANGTNLCQFIASVWTIIGNIYENPELLKPVVWMLGY